MDVFGSDPDPTFVAGHGRDIPEYRPAEEATADDQEYVVLGASAYSDECDMSVPHGAPVVEDVPATMFAEDAMSQDDITRTIDAIGLEDGANEKAYVEAKLCKLRLSKLEELYDNGDSVTAMKLLRQKNYLHIDSKYTVKPDHPNVVWFQEKVSEVLQRARRRGVN